MDQNLGKSQQHPAKQHGSNVSQMDTPPAPPPAPPPTPESAAPQQSIDIFSAAYMFESPFRQPAMPPVNVSLPRPPIFSQQNFRPSPGQKPGNSSDQQQQQQQQEQQQQQQQQQQEQQQQQQLGTPANADRSQQEPKRVKWGLGTEYSDSSEQDYRRFSDRSQKRTVFFNVAEPDQPPERSSRKRAHDESLATPRPLDSQGPKQYNFYTKKDKGKGKAGEDAVKAKKPHSKSDFHVEPVIPAHWLTIDRLKEVHPIGHMVFAKLPGYPWWPCFVISHRFSLNPQGQVIKLWVRWYGENDMSHVSLENIKPFDEFNTRFSAKEMGRNNYKDAIFTALETAAKRSKVTFESNPEDQTLNWVLPEGQPVPILAGDRDFYDSGNSSSEGSKKKKKKKTSSSSKRSEDVYLSTYQHELLEWALSGFQPHGTAGLWPTKQEQELLEQEVEAVPDSPPRQQEQEKNDQKKTTQQQDQKKSTQQQKKSGQKKGKAKPMLNANFTAVSEGRMEVADICISCGEESPEFNHPFFEGSLCNYCKDLFLQRTYKFDDEGSQVYCAVCSGGDQVYVCDSEDCVRVFCGPCIEKLCGDQELKEVIETHNWSCYMCKEVPRVGLLAKRLDWDKKLKELFDKDREMNIRPPPPHPPIPLNKRYPLRVLSIYDGSGTGFLLLKELGLKIEKYITAKFSPRPADIPPIYHKDIIHLGDSIEITSKQMMELGPFDLVIGGSPCNGLVSSSGKALNECDIKYFLEFFRLLELARPTKNGRPFLWLYENVVSNMLSEDKHLTSRFLNSNPVVVDAKEIYDSHSARYFWSNMSWMYSQPQEEAAAAVNQATNAAPQTEEDKLFRFTEFFPKTDSGLVRSSHFGKSWSVSVLKHLLTPLKTYFEYSEEEEELEQASLPPSLQASSSVATDTALTAGY